MRSYSLTTLPAPNPALLESLKLQFAAVAARSHSQSAVVPPFHHSHSMPTLRAPPDTVADFSNIVSALLQAEEDKVCRSKFILTYKLYQPPSVLFDLVSSYYLAKPGEGRKRQVSIFLKEWTTMQLLSDFRGPLLQQMLNFVSTHLSQEANFFKLLAIKALRAQKQIVTLQSAGVVSDNWLSYSPETIAAVLTSLEWKMFQLITPVDFYSSAWRKRNKTTGAVNTLARFFNQLGYWTSTVIIKAHQISQQQVIDVIKHLLNVAEELLKLNNFDSMMAILSGFGNCSVSRLRRLWELPEKYVQKKKRLEELMEMNSNFKHYRDYLALKPKEAPCVPYLALLLRDFEFINEGNPDFLERNKMNFQKMMLLGSKIQEVLELISVPYISLQEETWLEHFFRNMAYWEEDELYKRSLGLCCSARKKSDPGSVDETDNILKPFSPRSSISNPRNVSAWGVSEVLTWLECIGAHSYKAQFESSNINGSALLQLTDNMLLAILNITQLAHRKRILEAIKQLTTKNSKSDTLIPIRVSDTLEANHWTMEEVSNWIRASFAEGPDRDEILKALNGFNGAALLTLSNEDLSYIGLRATLRKAILKLVKQLLAVDWSLAPYPKDSTQWSVAEVFLWLHSKQLPQFIHLFIVQRVTGRDLFRLTNQDLINLGVKKLQHRMALLSAVQTLTPNSQSPQVVLQTEESLGIDGFGR